MISIGLALKYPMRKRTRLAGVDDNACPTTILFFSWVTLTEHCWDSFR